MKIEKNRNLGGLSLKKLAIPVAIIIAVLHLLVINFIISINKNSVELSELMNNNSRYVEDATSLLGGSSFLSETSSTFILIPVDSDENQNLAPLAAYASELKNNRRGNDIYQKFLHYNVSEEIKNRIKEAASYADYLFNIQIHAISLINKIYPIPHSPAFESIPLIDLTSEEISLNKDDTLTLARSLIINNDYAQTKQFLSRTISETVGKIKEETGVNAENISNKIKTARIMLWIFTTVIILISTSIFIFFYVNIVKPIVKFNKMIENDGDVDERKGVNEVRSLANSYNHLLLRRNTLEDFLRNVAETDALTNLPNRYGLEKFFLENKDTDKSFAIILFDLNYLKQTNDTYGHAAGDDLIKMSANAILNSFGKLENSYCSRIGGDEFIAAIHSVKQTDLLKAETKFNSLQKENNISIAYGVAYTDNLQETSIKFLMDQADKKLYKNKELMHNTHINEES